MSRGSAPCADATPQRDKLEPPRSLQDVEDAEMIWDMIAKRFPNAAPLLCEMETVIERAEDLLQQLRAAPCAQGQVDTSGSFHTPDSQESNTTISMVSDMEETEETNVADQVGAEQAVERGAPEEARVTVHVRRDQQDRQVEEHPDVGYHLNSAMRLDEVVQHFKTSSTKCQSSQGESDANVTDSGDKRIDAGSDERLAETMAEKSSLEGWTKAVDNALRQWRDDVENVDASAMSCAATQALAKSELAAKILWMVAERQMDGPKLLSSACGLSDLSREEMLEIIAFNQDKLKNAWQKVFKFCLERGKPAPEYTICNSTTNQGFVYTAQCMALGYVGIGQGLRKDSAKIAAAENLYRRYILKMEEQMT
ncbi:hypothetical protein EAI_15543 [Harpegnathos saltator]|uniref:DRBM domain-containing protein n=1 Tax=Harpegnathos saltator TaxID=610380 RepID=E2CA87_HARSA|nr:hypothetical protein EAI_15543 [Harpegnathos saltator]